MQQVPLAAITIRLRQRQEIREDPSKELADSIMTKGLLHPVVGREIHLANGVGYALVAGQRRILAMTHLHNEGIEFYCNDEVVKKDHIPIIVVKKDLGELLIREAELEENILREDLSWQDRARAFDELHKIRKAQDPKQTEKATAKEVAKRGGLARAVETTRKELAKVQVVVRHFDIPEVAEARNLSEAYVAATRHIENEFKEELARRQPKKSEHTLLVGDLRDRMAELPSNKFRCIVTDPPYGIDADKFGEGTAGSWMSIQRRMIKHDYADDLGTTLALLVALVTEAYRVTLPQAHMYIFCDFENFIWLRDTCAAAGWEPWRRPLIWDKGVLAQAPERMYGLRMQYECILLARKGGMGFTKLYGDILSFPSMKVVDRTHPAQKPLDLYVELLNRSAMPGDLVLDPCCGSGTIFVAATKLHMIATGIEMSERMAESAKKRMLA